MTIEVRVPQLPESVADATIVSWHKKPGDAVARDENLVDLETDKVVLEVPAAAAGVLKEIKLGDGTTVTSGQVLALIEEGATAMPGASAPAVMAVAGGRGRRAQGNQARRRHDRDQRAGARADRGGRHGHARRQRTRRHGRARRPRPACSRKSSSATARP